MTKIKICGLRRKEDILIVNKYKPDYIGFIFAEGRKRTIDIHSAKMLYNILDHSILAVGVFLDQDINFIKEALPYIDLIQLHGNEDTNYIKELKKITNKPIIKAYRNDSYADYYLLDNINPGSGVKMDFNGINKNDLRLFLAGGINISNIDEALKLNPYCIDVSSGVEVLGYKDDKKIEEITRRVKEYE